MKKTVWYISKYANIERYGADTRHASLCTEFAKSGHKVRLITSNSSHLYKSLPCFERRYHDEHYNGYEVTWINTLKYSHATGVLRFFSWVWFEFFVLAMCVHRRYERPDVVIASSLSLLSVFSGCFYKFFFNAKFIFEVRDIWPQTLIDMKGFSPKHPVIWLLSKIENLGYRYADKIVGTMPALNTHVDERVSLGFKVVNIPQGFNLNELVRSESALTQEFIDAYIPKNKFIVTYAGSMGRSNALEYILEAAKKLSLEGNNEVYFLMVGGGYLKAQLKKDSCDLPNVCIAPRVEKTQVQEILLRSNLLVASVLDENVYRYGISLNKFIDYMKAKKPILCMYSGYPSMINEANCGEFTPSCDAESFAAAIKKYSSLGDSELRKLGMNGYEFLVRYRTFEKLSKRYEDLF